MSKDKKPKFYTQYDLKEDPGIVFLDKSLTLQSEAPSCDINVIMDKYSRANVSPFSLEWVNNQQLQGDFTNRLDFRDSLQAIIDADEAFAGVPAELRKRFNNSSVEFYDFVTDPKNIDELISLGLATKAPDASGEPSNASAADGVKNKNVPPAAP